jgi:glucose-1-phosphate cytidylyltransferase
MKTIILAGGLGTRISEETETKPKPMVLIDDKPIIWHIMNIYASQGFNEFIIATGYKGEVIHDWVRTLNTGWKIIPLETGESTQTAGRIRQCMEYAKSEDVMVTYGDALANVNLHKLIDFHTSQGRLSTVTAVRPPARFGTIESENGLVTRFGEKSQSDVGWINGGFFYLNAKVHRYLDGDSFPFETSAMPRLVQDGQLSAFHHYGFWQPMDTLREAHLLQKLAATESPPWLSQSNSSTNLIID